MFKRQTFEASKSLESIFVKLFLIIEGQWISGIEPDDGFYSLDSISDAIKEGAGFTPGIECNRDSAHNSQLYQVYLCVDTSGSSLIECPILPRSKCGSQIQFPKF